MRKKAQSMIEFVFVMPMLMVLFFGIIEYSLYFWNIVVLQNIVAEATVKASRANVTESQTELIDPSSPNYNQAVVAVQNSVWANVNKLGIKKPVDVHFKPETSWGNAPYTVYTIETSGDYTVPNSGSRRIDGVSQPVLTLTVDYRNPDEEGIIVSASFWYRPLMFGGIEFPGNPPLTIIPKDILINSGEYRKSMSF